MSKTLAKEATLKISKADLQTAVEDYLNRVGFQNKISVSDIKYIATGSGGSSYQDVKYEILFTEVGEDNVSEDRAEE